MAAVGGRLAFSGWNAQNGIEPWITDGTAAGTYLLGDINKDMLRSGFGRFVELNGSSIFSVSTSDGPAPPRGELWRTDGTPQGTVMIKPMLGVAADSSRPFLAARLGNFVYYTDGPSNLELWRTDGTTAGTTRVMAFAGAPAPFSPSNFPIKSLTSIGGALYFEASDGLRGSELWKSNGTALGTVMVSDLVPATKSSILSGFTQYRGQIYFTGWTEATGRELFKTDGTMAGTMLVKDINAGTSGSFPNQFTVMGDTMYFIAATPENNNELWKTDGTAAGTALVREFYPGGFETVSSLQPLGKYLIVRSSSPDSRAEVWSLDTTTGNIEPLKDLRPGDQYANPRWFTVYKNAVYFIASGVDDAVRLWKTDGTEAGTVMVKEVPPNPFGSQISSFYTTLFVAGDTLFFTPSDGPHGRELWRSDGTTEGTRLAQDIQPGPGDSTPLPLASLGDALLFAANDGVHGSELWRFDPPAVRSAEHAATEGGNRISVTFSENVKPSLTASDLAVRRTGGDTTEVPVAAVSMTYDDATNTAVFELPVLPAGRYTAVLSAAGVTDVFENPMSRNFATDFTASSFVIRRQVFYNNSAFDAARSLDSDDDAIAPDKRAWIAGSGPATFANVTSYTRGINGVMIDIAGLPEGVELTPDDFTATPPPVSVLVRRGRGSDQTDRVTLYWPDYNPASMSVVRNVVANGWLTVVVKANERTGLARPDAFTFGNLIGETGDASARFAVVNALDVANVRRALNTDAGLASRVDFNRDGRVNALDLAVARTNYSHFLTPPPAPAAQAFSVAAPSRRATVDLLADGDTVPPGTE